MESAWDNIFTVTMIMPVVHVVVKVRRIWLGEMVGEAHIISVKAATGSAGWLGDHGMGRMGVLPTTCIVFVHLTIRRIAGGARSTSPLHECLVASKVLADS